MSELADELVPRLAEDGSCSDQLGGNCLGFFAGGAELCSTIGRLLRTVDGPSGLGGSASASSISFIRCWDPVSLGAGGRTGGVWGQSISCDDFGCVAEEVDQSRLRVLRPDCAGLVALEDMSTGEEPTKRFVYPVQAWEKHEMAQST